ncbi:MAG: hypothetical protein GY714_22465 [Desulfobacterales bacterium]|nr:hypothetical protein [Desulfobacterales bacterium]
MNNDLIIIIYMLFSVAGSIVVVNSKNHIHMSIGYIAVISGITGIMFYINAGIIALILLLIHTISVVLIISFGIFACGFQVIVIKTKERFAKICGFLSATILFLVMTMILLKNDFIIINQMNSYKLFGELLTEKYFLLLELIALSILIAVTGSVIVLRKRGE